MLTTLLLSSSSSRKRFGESCELVGPKIRRYRSKNCMHAKQQRLIAQRRRCKEDMEATKRLQEQIEALDRHLTLVKGRGLVARQNAQTAAMKLIESYCGCVATGYDPNGAPEQAQVTEQFLVSAFEDDVKTPDFTGRCHLLAQLELFTLNHASAICRVDSVEILNNSEGSNDDHVVKTRGVTTLEISRATIENVFPHLLANETLAHSLIGKKYGIPYTLIAYVDASTGRVTQLESKVDLASALMELLRDPVVAVQTVNATTIDNRGYMLLSDEVREDQNVFESGFL